MVERVLKILKLYVILPHDMGPMIVKSVNLGGVLRKYHFSILKKRIFNGWSKSIVLENKVAINFDFKSGAKKSGHLDYPLQSYGPKQVRLICTHPWLGANKPDLFGAITLQRIIQMT